MPTPLNLSPFSAASINKLMWEILYGMAFLEHNRMVHGDMRPSLIGVPLLPTDNFKLLDRLGNSRMPDQIQRNNIKDSKPLYMSPDLFHSIMKNKQKIKHNPFKSDIFAFGLILLEAGVLEPIQPIFNTTEKKINEQVLVKLVEKFIQRYPKDYTLQEGLMIMLEFQEKLRYTPIDLLAYLRELKESSVEDGRTEGSHIHHNTDFMMNKVRFTDSGYEFNDADQFLVSNFSRIQAKSAKSLLKSENVTAEEMERNTLEMLKNKRTRDQQRLKVLGKENAFDHRKPDGGEEKVEDKKEVYLFV